MLDQRSSSDRRDLESRRNGMDRRLNIMAVSEERRSRFDRRSMTNRRIFMDRRMTAISFRDIV
jgi:hypothetical protein